MNIHVTLTPEQIDAIAIRVVDLIEARMFAPKVPPTPPSVTFEEAAWGELFEHWHRKFGNAPVGSGDLLPLATTIPGIPISGATAHAKSCQFGRQLRHLVGISLNGFTVSDDCPSVNHARQYRLIPTEHST